MSEPQISPNEITEMAIAILRATEDGNLLIPDDLVLVKLAVNRNLNANGAAELRKLLESAAKPGGYTAPWLFEIDHLTMDHERFIRWKGVAVEHFDHAVWRRPGWRERMRADADALAARRRQLEAEGIEPLQSLFIANLSL